MAFETIEKWILAALTAATTGVLWLIRQTYGNKRAIREVAYELELEKTSRQKDVERATALRERDHEALMTVCTDIKDIKSFLMEKR